MKKQNLSSIPVNIIDIENDTKIICQANDGLEVSFPCDHSIPGDIQKIILEKKGLTEIKVTTSGVVRKILL